MHNQSATSLESFVGAILEKERMMREMAEQVENERSLVMTQIASAMKSLGITTEDLAAVIAKTAEKTAIPTETVTPTNTAETKAEAVKAQLSTQASNEAPAVKTETESKVDMAGKSGANSPKGTKFEFGGVKAA